VNSAVPGTPRRIHLIGICGTGMASLAGLLQSAGYDVSGSDESVFPPMSTMLAARGIPVQEGYKAEHLDDRPDLVVVGNIATPANAEAVAARERGLPYLSMAETVGRLFLQGHHSMVVSGTHGKTTTSALLAWVLHAAGRRPSFLVGGVLRNFDRSFDLGDGEEFVIEGDEYETAFFDKGPKFLHYRPRTAILTSVEFDHAEMYRDLAAVQAAFRKFVALLPPEGRLIVCADDANAAAIASGSPAPVETYGLGEGVEWRGRAVQASPDGVEIEITRAGAPFLSARTTLFGPHNLRNALAVTAAAASRGLAAADIAAGLASFAGVRRRQEVRGETAGVTVLDDFAHHPTAVRVTLEGLRQQYGSRRLWAVFEPRTNTTRRSVFQDEYADAFGAADRVIVAAVDHPERAPEGERFSAERLVQDLADRGLWAQYLPNVDAIIDRVAREARTGDVVAIMSNGAFGGIHARLLDALQRRPPGA
jgi:UDP-N-acetylmuramate: L-alanyl-gamma-D-glutamyl-meso-diaminopimelate ligase